MRSREDAPKGSRWFMVLSLLAMAAALVMVGKEVTKSRDAATVTATSATQSVADTPSPGFVNTEDTAPYEPPPAASEAGSGAPAGSAGTNPEAIRNQ